MTMRSIVGKLKNSSIFNIYDIIVYCNLSNRESHATTVK